MGLFDSLVRLSLPLVPRSVVWQVARRYVAGESLQDCMAALERNEADGFGTILDVLGEAVPSEAGAREAVAEYDRALDALADREWPTIVSVKPTHLGLNFGVGLCEELLSGLCERAAARGRFVRFEMEDHPTIDGTLEVFEAVRARHENVGCVLQARLFRTREDVDRLLERFGAGLDVRLVKGIYLEPPEIAWTEPDHITGSYVELADALVEGGARP
jgi:proline dehydrogenase